MQFQIKGFIFVGERLEVMLIVNGKEVIFTFGFIQHFTGDDWRFIDILGNQLYTGTPYSVAGDTKVKCNSEGEVKEHMCKNISSFVTMFIDKAYTDLQFNIIRVNEYGVPIIRNFYWDVNDYREGWTETSTKAIKCLKKNFFLSDSDFESLSIRSEHVNIDPVIPKEIRNLKDLFPKEADIYNMEQLRKYCEIPVFEITLIGQGGKK